MLPPINRDYRWLLTLCFTQAGALLVFLNYAGALPLVQQDWNLTNAQAGAIQSAGQFGYVIAVLLLASLSDFIDEEWLIIVGAFWAGLSNLGFAFLANSVPVAMVFRAFIGLGIAGIYMPGVRAISQRFPRAVRGRVIGVFVASFTVGTAASVTLGGGLAAAIGWRMAFSLTSIGAVSAGFVALYARLRNPPRPQKRQGSDPSRPFSELFHNRTALLAIFAYVFHTWVLFGLRSWLPAFLSASLVLKGSQITIATRDGSVVAGIATLLAAGGTAGAAALSDRIGRTTMLIAIFSLALCSLLGLGLMFSFPWIFTILVALLAVVAVSADSAIISTILTERVPPDYLGRSLAVYSFSGFTAGAVSPLMVGMVLDVASSSVVLGEVVSNWFWGFASLALVSFFGVMVAVALHFELRPSGAPVDLVP